ncbi:hypothetical protein LCGC14_2822370 [marine sediment metagenome]|uniref:Uncharacterized protein n=1 Tax=marine sediment metagenome TaxID=412755 RepID=A0A0F8YGF5_9ZZZZ
MSREEALRQIFEHQAILEAVMSPLRAVEREEFLVLLEDGSDEGVAAFVEANYTEYLRFLSDLAKKNVAQEGL